MENTAKNAITPQRMDWPTLCQENRDIGELIYTYPSPTDLYNLSCTSRAENKRFYQFVSISERVQEYLATKLANLQNEYDATFFLFRPFLQRTTATEPEIVAEFPDYRQGRFKALGDNGRNLMAEKYGIKNDLAVNRIRSGQETIESAKKNLEQKEKEIRDSFENGSFGQEEKSHIELLLKGMHINLLGQVRDDLQFLKNPILQCILEEVLTIPEALHLDRDQIKLILKMDADGDIAKYNLNQNQIRDIIFANFNPFSSPAIKCLVSKNILGIDHVFKLTPAEIATLKISEWGEWGFSGDPISTTLWSWRNGINPNQALDIIQKKQAKKFHPLADYDTFCKNLVNGRLLYIRHIASLNEQQLKRLLYDYFEDMESTTKSLKLNQNDNFNIVKNNFCFYSSEFQDAIRLGLLTPSQATRLDVTYQGFLKVQLPHLPKLAEKYNLTKDEIHNIILKKSNPLCCGMLGWAVDDKLLTKEQVLGWSLEETVTASQTINSKEFSQLSAEGKSLAIQTLIEPLNTIK